ncbi:MAG: LCP family protein [Anaerovoracaceae bacterium]|jgi:LCP family protein required for cell wall assembly
MRSDKKGYYSEEDFEKEFGGRLSGEDGAGSDHQEFSVGRRGKKKEKKGRKKREKVSGKKNSRKKTVIIVLASLIILIGAGAMLGYFFLLNKLDKVDQVDVSKEDLDIDPRVAEELKDYQNILLLGIDTNPQLKEDDDKARSDGIIIVSINKKTKDVKLISVYRDSFLDVEENGYHRIDKVNHAHAYGGPVNTIRALNRNLDLNIESYVRLNWRTVAEVTDSMGGLVVYVDEKTRQELNRCIYVSARDLGMDNAPVEVSGNRTLNGIQIVGFCRMRMADGDDARAGRMREVIDSAFNKMKTMKLSQLNNVVDLGLSQVQTSLSSKEMMGMLMDINSYHIGESIGWPAKWEGAMIDGVSYDIPVTLKTNVIDLHEKAFGQKNYKPTDRVLKINERIKSKSGYYGEEGTDYNYLEWE